MFNHNVWFRLLTKCFWFSFFYALIHVYWVIFFVITFTFIAFLTKVGFFTSPLAHNIVLVWDYCYVASWDDLLYKIAYKDDTRQKLPRRLRYFLNSNGSSLITEALGTIKFIGSLLCRCGVKDSRPYFWVICVGCTAHLLLMLSGLWQLKQPALVHRWVVHFSRFWFLAIGYNTYLWVTEVRLSINLPLPKLEIIPDLPIPLESLWPKESALLIPHNPTIFEKIKYGAVNKQLFRMCIGGILSIFLYKLFIVFFVHWYSLVFDYQFKDAGIAIRDTNLPWIIKSNLVLFLFSLILVLLMLIIMN